MSAVISDCGLYRYRLERGDEPRLPFVMLNPSTADATQDDPTIRRCIGFAKREGCTGIVVVNLYALRATDPKQLWRSGIDRFGPLNQQALEFIGHQYRRIIVAWGSNADKADAKMAYRALTTNPTQIFCFGKTKDGSPRHPLYVRGDQPLQEWTP